MDLRELDLGEYIRLSNNDKVIKIKDGVWGCTFTSPKIKKLFHYGLCIRNDGVHSRTSKEFNCVETLGKSTHPEYYL